jgi:pimeloyl-ACP methyl ester carboxylesterase
MHARIKHLSLSVAGLTGLAVVSGVLYEQWSRWDAGNEHPPPGLMVEVDGHRLHLNCTGSGSPTIVMESGGGTTGSLSFVLVQPEIAKSHRVCSYDRAGIMRSERRDGTPSAVQIADDLHSLLTNASEPGPYVIVGYSLGGLFIRVFEQKYPEEVVGMLFVEPAHPEDWERLDPLEGSEAYEYSSWNHLKQLFLTGTGIARLTGFGNFENLPDEAMIANDFRPYSYPAFDKEMFALPQMHAEAAETSALGDLPIIVLTGEQMLAPPTPEAAASMSPEEVRNWNEWVRVLFEMREEIAALSTNGEHRVIEGSGHSMSYDAPDAVIRGVHDVVAKCCSDQGASE